MNSNPFSKGLLLLALLFFSQLAILAQPGDSLQVQSTEEDLLSLIGNEEEQTYTTATFKTTRVINLQSVENAAAGVMDFRISHRFGFINTGAYDLFGLDQALMRFGLEYGITDRLMVGVGRSNVNKAYDSFLKYKILRQGSGKHNIPISLSYFGSAVCNTVKWSDPNRDNYFSSRLQYTHQLLIARKFNNDLSLQIAPTLVHKNLVPTLKDKNDILAMGFGGRYKLTQRFSVNGEYIYVLPNQITSTYYNSLSLGVDIETGGHVFQLHLTNSTSMLEPGFITESVGQWKNGGIHFGFNVSRVFTVVDKREKPED
ncbi:MAG: hypothetical protein RLZZ155_1456 [Bacteroidota bacterium]|jgi:hypothetical protein